MRAVSYKRGKVWCWSCDAQDDAPLIREAVEEPLIEPGEGWPSSDSFGTY